MQSLKNTKSKPVGRPPKMIKPYKSSRKNTVIFLALVVLAIGIAFKFGTTTVVNEPIKNASESATPQPTPTIAPLFSCDPFTSSITDGKITKTCIDPKATPTPTPKPSPKPAKVSLKPSDEEIVAYIQSKDWDASTAVRIAKSENFFNLTGSFNCTRQGGLNSDGTRDHGIFQINDIHIRSGAITLEDANDCYKSTDFAYRLYKGRGNFTAWSAFNNLAYLNHSDSI